MEVRPMGENGLLFAHGVLNANKVIIDYLDDTQRRLKRVMAEVDDVGLHWSPDPGANSIAVTLWHMGRLFDVFLTRQVMGESSERECWIRNGWAAQTDYDPRGLGRDGWGSVNRYTPDEVASIPRFTKEQLLCYLDDVYGAVKGYVQVTSMTDLAEPAPGFDEHYTKYQVLSMALLDNVRHLGEVRALKAMRERVCAQSK
jgi:hypothetical protein